MKRIKKSLALLVALVMCVSLLSLGGFASGVGLDNLEGIVVILHTNDVHGRDVADSASYGTAAVSFAKSFLQMMGAKVLLLSAGDAIQGLPLVNYDYGATAIHFMSEAGYDAMAPGNHEFDWGAQNLFDILEENANFPVLAANIIFTEGNEYGGEAGGLVFPANKIFDLDGVKIGVFGLATPETYTKAHPDKVKGIAFLQGAEMFAAAQEQVDFLKSEGCDFVVCLGHLGVDDESAGNRSTDVIEAVTGIDVFIDGHSHTVFQEGKMVGDTLLASTGTALANIGAVVIDPATGEKIAGLFGIVNGEKAFAFIDEELNDIINARDDYVKTTLKSQLVGATDALLYGKNTTSPAGVRVAETNLGDFATDALLWLANKVYGEGFTDAALTNGGGIRDSIPNVADAAFPYEITMFDMVTVFPFGNQVEIVEITGAQLLEALEAATFSSPGVVGAFPQVSGIEFEIHNYVPYERGEQYANSTYYAPADPGARIRNVTVGGEPLDLDRVYRIATNDFTAAGGDTYGVFKDRAASYSTGVAMEQALIDYVAEELGGVVDSRYAEPQGRIKVFFLDLPAETQWWTPAFIYAFSEGIIEPTESGYWEPETKVDVALAIQAIYNMEGRPAAEGESFPDVSEADWFYDAALWAKSIGLSKGNDYGEFNGQRLITRYEQAAIITRYLEICGYVLESADISGFGDADQIPEWALEEGIMQKMVGSGIMQGTTDGSLLPNNQAMRYELARLLLNVAEFIDIYDNALDEAA